MFLNKEPLIYFLIVSNYVFEEGTCDESAVFPDHVLEEGTSD